MQRPASDTASTIAVYSPPVHTNKKVTGATGGLRGCKTAMTDNFRILSIENCSLKLGVLL